MLFLTSAMIIKFRCAFILKAVRLFLSILAVLFVSLLTTSIVSDKLIDGFGCDLSIFSSSALVVNLQLLQQDRHQHLRRNDDNDDDVLRDGQVSNRSDAGRLFPVDRPFIILTIGYHESPIQDLIDTLEPLGVRIIQKGIISYGCNRFNSCRTTGNRVKDLLAGRLFHWLMNERWTELFYSKYHDDPDWQSADAFICFHPAATCQLFLPFDKPIIIWATIRVDNGRMFTASRHQWLETLATRIAASSNSIIAANNRYDVEYTRYFTGVHSVLLPSFCGYTRTTYRPTRPGFLVYRPARAAEFLRFFMEGWARTCRSMKVARPVSLYPIHELYPNHEYAELASHRGIVNLPLQPSMMSIFEQYRMNVPLFFPSYELLVRWHIEHGILYERNIYFDLAGGASFAPSASQQHIPHPNSDQFRSVAYWLKLSDWYILPYIYYYNSFEELVILLNSITDAELIETSAKMKRYNEEFKLQLVEKWREVLLKVAQKRLR